MFTGKLNKVFFLIKEKYLEQHTLSKLNNTQHIFSKKMVDLENIIWGIEQ